jgi:hypothetical protein
MGDAFNAFIRVHLHRDTHECKAKGCIDMYLVHLREEFTNKIRV